MNRICLALSMMTLGVVIGITITHYQHVRDVVTYDLSRQAITAGSNNPNADNSNGEVLSSIRHRVLIASSEKGNAKNLTREDDKGKEVPTTAAQEQALLEILTAIRAEQNALRRQISESNRDIDELTFRVDTHSDSFKPLHALDERPQLLDGSAKSLDSNAAGLLPPK